MKTQFAIAAIRKNGFLVYKDPKSKEMMIRKKSEFVFPEKFYEAVVRFNSREEAEAFVRENEMVSVEIVELD
jgi:hypothetical protein